MSLLLLLLNVLVLNDFGVADWKMEKKDEEEEKGMPEKAELTPVPSTRLQSLGLSVSVLNTLPRLFNN